MTVDDTYANGGSGESLLQRDNGKTKCRFRAIASRQDVGFFPKSWHAGTHCQTWLENKRAAGKQICVWWDRWSAVPLASTHTQQHTRRTPQTEKHIVPTTCGLRPLPRSPRHWRKSCGCNEISYRFFNETQYYILSGPRFFPFHTRPTQIRTEERINTNQEKSQTPGNLSALDFKVWARFTRLLGRC